VSANPVLIEVTRGAAVESRHRGAFAIVDAAGKIVKSAGDAGMPVFPRSAAKPLQAIPLIETGAAGRFGLTGRELALACASHKGEPAHVEAVEAWPRRIGLGPEALECGVQAPRTQEAASRAILAGTPLNAAYHNCSGKHAGFLCACVARGDEPAGYIDPDHPAQKRVARALAEMTGCDLAAAPMGRDGCGIPTYCMPLRGLATGMARLADPSGLPAERAEAASRIVAAMTREPFYVNGTGGFTTEVMAAAPAVCVKGGAEGVYAAALPALGLGLALKIDDGAMRAAECAAAHILRALQCFSADEERRLGRFLEPASRPAGVIRPAAQLLSSLRG
jgi:L-asparaginase II